MEKEYNFMGGGLQNKTRNFKLLEGLSGCIQNIGLGTQIHLIQEFSQFGPSCVPKYIFQRLMYELFCGWHLPKTAKLAIKAMFFGLLWPFVTTETNVIHSNLEITNLNIVNFAI